MNIWKATGGNKHHLKTYMAPFQAVWDDEKLHEFRRDDRPEKFKVGDVLVLSEFCADTKQFTNRKIRAIVTYKTSGGEFQIPEGFCVMTIRPFDRSVTKPKAGEIEMQLKGGHWVGKGRDADPKK